MSVKTLRVRASLPATFGMVCHHLRLDLAKRPATGHSRCHGQDMRTGDGVQDSPVMSPSQDHGERDDQPCPQWCVTGSGHLCHRSQHCVDLWHEGPEVNVATQFADEYRIPIKMHVRLDQREQVDARGHSRHPVRVACGRYSLSPDQARELASVLLQMAGDAEQVAE